MELVLKRIALRETYTIGHLYVNGKYFCDTCEDKVRDLTKESKVYAETAIPYGRYKICLCISPKFKRLLPKLLNVPHFEGVLIHRGNTAADSAGCILVGENKEVGKVLNSTKMEQNLVSMLKKAFDNQEDIYIDIQKS